MGNDTTDTLLLKALDQLTAVPDQPITLRDFLSAHLCSKGLMLSHADSILDAMTAAPDDSLKPWVSRFSEPYDSYPPAVMAAGIVLVDAYALAWLDKHMPDHFARTMFE